MPSVGDADEWTSGGRVGWFAGLRLARPKREGPIATRRPETIDGEARTS